MPKVIVNSGYIKSSAHYINYLEYAGNKLEAQTLVLNDGTKIELEPDELYDVAQSDFKYIEIKTKDGGNRKLNKSQYISYVSTVEDGVIENQLVRNDGLIESLEPVTYLKYIGYRPSVEKYRNASHGLFDLQGMANMDDVKQTILNNENSIKWSHIISLKDEDAERLGYDNRQAWEDLIRAKAYDIAKIYNIPPEHLKIYAAFHKKDHHPHCHLFMLSDANNSNHGFIKGGTEAMIKASERMRSMFTNEIFKDDVQSLKIDKNALRLELRAELNKYIYDIGSKNYTPYKDIVHSFSNLTASLTDYQGKASYAYISAEQKKLVNDVLAKAVSCDKNIGKIFQQIIDNQREFISLYNDDADKIESRLQDFIDHFFEPSQKNDYRVLHNAIIKQAMLYNQHLHPPVVPGVVRKENSLSNETDDFDGGYVAETQTADVVRKEKSKSNNYMNHSKYWSDGLKEARQLISTAIKIKAEGQNYFSDTLFSESAEILNKEIEKGNPLAAFELAECYKKGYFGKGNVVLAQDYYQKALTGFINQLESDEWLQHLIAKDELRNLRRKMLQSEYEKRLKRIEYKISNDVRMEDYLNYKVGCMYIDGNGIESDIELGIEYLKQSNSAFAKYKVGSIYYKGEGVEQNYQLAFEYFESACNNEGQEPMPYALYNMAEMIENKAVTETDYKASDLYRIAFERYVADDEKSPDDKTEYRIASMLLDGKGVEPDLEKAIDYLKQSAEKGNQNAQYTLGKIYLSDEYGVYDFSTAVAYLEQSAEQGNQYAQYTLGKIYLSDDYGVEDVDMAIMYLTRSAEQDNQFAQYTLGVIYSDEGFKGANKDLAKEYFTKSAKQGNEYAQYKLGKLLIDEVAVDGSYGFNFGLGLEWIKKSAEQGNQYAQYALGKIYLSDEYGVKNVDKAIEYLELSAEQDNQFAQYTLGVIYSDDEYGKADENLAEECFTKSAEQGNQFAQYKLGKMLIDKVATFNSYGFYLGLGLNWLKQSAEQNNQYAQYELGRIYLSDEYGIKNIDMSITYFKQAAEQDNQYAQYVLGKIYLSDEYGVKDIDAAISYLNQSAKQNNEFAQYQLGKLYYFGNDFISPDKELGMHYLKLSAEQGNEYAKNTINNIVNRNNAGIMYSAKLMLSELARAMALIAVNSFHQQNNEENKHKNDRPKFVADSHQKSAGHYQSQSHSPNNSIPR